MGGGSRRCSCVEGLESCGGGEEYAEELEGVKLLGAVGMAEVGGPGIGAGEVPAEDDVEVFDGVRFRRMASEECGGWSC